MEKQVIEIEYDGKLIAIAPVKTYENLQKFFDNQVEAAKNFKELLTNKDNQIKELTERLEKVEIELKYNRGEITEKEYEELCGGKK